MEILSQWIIPIVVALIAGAFGSIIAPWANWNVQKKKIKFEAKKQLINDIRKYLSTRFYIQEFKEKSFYYEIRDELDSEIKNIIDNCTLDFINKLIYNYELSEFEYKLKHQLLNELNVIAKRWKIE